MMLLVLLALTSATVIAFQYGPIHSTPLPSQEKVARIQIAINKSPIRFWRGDFPQSPFSFALLSESEDSAVQPEDNKVVSPADVSRSSGLVKLYYRSSWISWWVQIILTVIAGVILTFANTVRQSNPKDTSIWMSGFAFSVISAVFSGVNCFWTWNTAKSSVRLNKMHYKRTNSTLRRYCQTAVGISLLGIFANIIGAEQIAGTLASKVLSTQSIGGILTTNQVANSFQPLDIFLVQANTNILVSHFASLVCFILLQTQL